MNGTACITIVRHMALRWTSKYARVIYSNCRILQTFISLVENLLYNVRETLRRFISHLVYRRLISCALAIDRLVNSDRRSVGRRLISLQSGLRYERGAFPFFSYSDNRFYSYNYDRDRINHASENLLAEPPCHSCLPEGALSPSPSLNRVVVWHINIIRASAILYCRCIYVRSCDIVTRMVITGHYHCRCT